MVCIVVLLGVIVFYDVVRYTLFGRRYLTVGNHRSSFGIIALKWMDCWCCLAPTYTITEKPSYQRAVKTTAIPAYETDEVI